MTAAQMLFGFEGRIGRTRYWLWSIGLGVLVAVVGGVELAVTGAVDTFTSHPGVGAVGATAQIGRLVFFAMAAAATWSFLALEVKRWHDRDKSWLWILIGLVPVIDAPWILIECGFLGGTQGPNRFGPSPKDPADPPSTLPLAPALGLPMERSLPPLGEVRPKAGMGEAAPAGVDAASPSTASRSPSPRGGGESRELAPRGAKAWSDGLFVC